MSARLHVVSGQPGQSWDYVPEIKPEIHRWINIDPQLRYDLYAKLQLAEEGNLRWGADVKYPLDEAPELAELRFIQDRRRHFRLYFAEPPDVPHCLVALKFHRKDIAASDVRKAQDEAIHEAHARYEQWRAARPLPPS